MEVIRATSDKSVVRPIEVFRPLGFVTGFALKNGRYKGIPAVESENPFCYTKYRPGRVQKDLKVVMVE